MRLVIQRIIHARVVSEGKVVAEIASGMLILAGIGRSDSYAEAQYLAKRVPELRIFKDDAGKMNLNLKQANGSLLLVPNFTLYGDCSRGRRPGFDAAARPEIAKPLFDYLVSLFMNNNIPTESGIFGADMQVELINDGPVTFVLESPLR
jgi:D-tyrosyl-tRNA(Tyr) deacylase